jgi:exodeoxyribonuclease VII large subunit
MTGFVELAPDGQHLLIRFPYREDLVAAVKELPGRRWDPKGKLWRVPATAVEQVFAALSRHLFEFAPEIPSLLAGTLRLPAPESRNPPLPVAAKPSLAQAATEAELSTVDPGQDALTVSALNHRVRDLLRGRFPAAFWVVGEIVEFDKSAGRAHRFFQLVEKAPHEARPLAVVEVALFAAAAERLLPALAAHDPQLVLRDGLEVRLSVRVDLYPATGRFQIVVEDIDPSFTLGKLALTREQVLRELHQLGLADRNRSLGFPVPATRIGVLTSPDADGWNDLRRHLEESGGGFDVTLVPIRVQGRDLKPMLLAGLRWFAAHAADFDVLCIVRGGGSRTDLAWFDDRDLALAVARHPLKIVVGIGHQRDQSVLDRIAHSEKTPTAVAELLVRGVETARADLQERSAQLRMATLALLAATGERLRHAALALQRACRTSLAEARAALAALGAGLVTTTRLRLQGEAAELARAAVRVQHGADRRLDHAKAWLEREATRTRLLDPVRVLQRGFVLVRDAEGRVVPTAARLRPTQALRLQFRDGHADAHLDAIERKPS